MISKAHFLIGSVIIYDFSLVSIQPGDDLWKFKPEGQQECICLGSSAVEPSGFQYIKAYL